MSLRKRDVNKVYAAEGYHPVCVLDDKKVPKRRKLGDLAAGQTFLVGHDGCGCAIDDYSTGDGYISMQTRGLLSVALGKEANVTVGALIYAQTVGPTIALTVDLAGEAKRLVFPWGIVLQRGAASRTGEVTVRAFKFPGGNRVLNPR